MSFEKTPMDQNALPFWHGRVRLSIRLCLTLICILVAWPAPGLTAPKATELQQRLADIHLLHRQLQEKIEGAEGLRESLYAEMKMLRGEVVALKKENGVDSFNTAIKIPRIRYNLTLIRELKGYIANFNEKIRFLQIGADKLYYLYQQAEDDLKIIHTLNDLKIEALQSQIDAVMGAYLPEAHKLLIDLNRIPYETPERIWKEILRKAS